MSPITDFGLVVSSNFFPTSSNCLPAFSNPPAMDVGLRDSKPLTGALVVISIMLVGLSKLSK
jgi:hypothetical protein